MAKIRYHKQKCRPPKGRKIDSIVGEDYKNNYKERLQRYSEFAHQHHKACVKAKEILLRNGIIPTCMAEHIGIIVVNKCLKRNIFINTQKLEKLLVLMQIEHMKRVKKKLFPEDIYVWKCGVVIEEVDSSFAKYAIECTEEQEELILLLEEQEKTINYVLEVYGNMDAMEINELPEVQKLISMSISVNGEKVIPSDIMLGMYL